MTTTNNKQINFHTHTDTHPFKNQTEQNTEDIPVRSGIGPSFSAARLAFMLLSPLLNEYCYITLELQWLCNLGNQNQTLFVMWEKIRSVPYQCLELQTSSPMPGGCLCLTIKSLEFNKSAIYPILFLPNLLFPPESLDIRRFPYSPLSFTNDSSPF